MSFFKRDAFGELIYLTPFATIDKPAPQSGKNVSGYGSKIPCSKMIQTEQNGIFRRVYCRIFSNIGTCYIVVKGERYIVNI